MPAIPEIGIVSKAIAELINDSDKPLVVWIGAGLSTCSFPNWQSALTNLCDKCGVKRDNIPEKASILMKLADTCKKKNMKAYTATLGKMFGLQPPQMAIPQNYIYLVHLGFKGYITTNFDPLLRNAFTQCNESYEIFFPPDLIVTKLNSSPDKCLYYIHGTAYKDGKISGKDLTLSKTEFKEAYDPDNSMLFSFLQQVLYEHRILFVGCSLREPEVEEMLRRVAGIHNSIRLRYGRDIPQRIALLPARFTEDQEGNYRRELEREDSEKRRFDSLSIRVLRYDPIDSAGTTQHHNLSKILRSVCDLTGALEETKSRLYAGRGIDLDEM